MNGDDDGDDDDDDDVMLRPIDKMTSCNQQDRHSSYHTYFEIRTVRLRFSNRPNAQRPEPKRTRSEYSIQPITQNPPPRKCSTERIHTEVGGDIAKRRDPEDR